MKLDPKELIAAWIASPKYWEGVKIYEQYGTSNFLKGLFAGSEDDFNRQKLETELTEMLAKLEAEEQEEQNDMPHELYLKLEHARRLMDERSALKEKMRVYHTQRKSVKQIGKLAFRVLDIVSELNEIYALKRFWQLLGYLPEKTDVQMDSVEKLIKRRSTLRTYVSRYSGDSKKEDLLKKYESELFEVNKKLEAQGVN